ncbi:hypothetical protein [Desulfovibrio sp. ZJ369]|uniref:hypothetical protein n=1 Tax=Desulfovibrio sp. ZJ369 TaxID=2709793 RepID=UPI00197E71B5|nr:hypothetical protein [Desulfovibrio sp. ZJ369]
MPPHALRRKRGLALLRRPPFALLVLLLALCLFTGCASARRATQQGSLSGQAGQHVQTEEHANAGTGSALPRADPGYLQWLERQSMLGAAPGFTAQVSGTERIWRNSAAARRMPLLLRAAPNWLAVNPHLVNAAQPMFRALDARHFTEFLNQAGLNGLFLAPTGERGDIWIRNTPPSARGENVTSLNFDPALGDDADFEKLAGRLEQAQIQLGGELPPAATGLGPDFFLQARRASRFDGLYAMIAVPRKDWELLPKAPDEWECLPLRPQAAHALAERGILPPAMSRDNLPWATPGGWAATGEVRGADGQIRRWVYRYNGSVLRPVLLWQDPSGQARRIFSAAVIRHTGLQRQTLAGLRLEALMGLDVPPVPAESAPTAFDKTALHALWTARLPHLTPGLEALDDAAREVHRYGGWAMQDDVLPPSLTPAVLATAVDFTRDTITAPATAYALLSGDVGPLNALLRASLAAHVDHSRLARGLHDWQVVDWRPLLDLPQGRELARNAQTLAKARPEELRLRITPASLAAASLGLDAAAAARPENAPALRRACLLLLGWRMGLPGLAFIGPQELTGALNLPQPPAGLPTGPGSVPLWGESLSSGTAGAPPAPLAFGTLEEQWTDSRSFLQEAARLLRARHQAGLAQGTLLAVLPGPPGCLAVLSSLPDGGWWLLAANFSAQKRAVPLSLPAGIQARAARDMGDGTAVTLSGRTLEIELDAREARHVLLAGPARGGDG